MIPAESPDGQYGDWRRRPGRLKILCWKWKLARTDSAMQHLMRVRLR